MKTKAVRAAAALRLAGGVLLGAALVWGMAAWSADDPKAERAPGHWPQWRGSDRNSVSRETGLLKEWPDKGPPLAWQIDGLGDGVASVAVAGGRIFTLGKHGDDEHLIALDEDGGKKLWSVALGPAMKGESGLMRWLSQRTPTVDADRVYAVTARGELVCLRTADGKEVWRKSYPNDFKGRTGPWGWCDRPLVDGDRLICTPGARDAAVVALDKKTGEVVWRCAAPGDPHAAYCATATAEVGGVRQYVAFLGRGLVGVAAKDGRFLWSYEKISNGTGNSYTPLVRGDRVFCASGYGKGMALLKLTADKDEVRAEEVWYKSQSLQPWHDGAILVGEHAYVGAGSAVLCVELETGKVVWQERGAVGGAVSMAAAEGKLYLLSQKGEAALIEASPKGYTLKGRLQLPDAIAKPGATAPVIAGGRLYLRDDDRLFCYAIAEGARVDPGKKPEPAKPAEPKPGEARAARPAKPGEPDAVFVPTPQDVVEKMVELARLQPGDVVFDLGCGDGRIVATAAHRCGCKAVGYDIDPECVRLARENVQRQGVGRLATIEQRDLFTVDLGGADAVMLYLSPELNERLLPQLARLKPGSRIVSHAFRIPGVPPDQVVTVASAEDHLDHQVYVWTTPLKKAQGRK
jgi:outer membrane protein assembly factor BamB/precorrin-6B methylase 2